MEKKPVDPEEEILQMIEDCEARQDQMSEWEQSFIDSISVQLGRGSSLSIKQTQTLTRIWDKVTTARGARR